MAEWQKGTGWKEWFEITGADGVDFHPIGQDPRKNPTIVLQSNTKEDILERKVGYPKSSYSFWKKINGKKYYISLDNPTEVTHKVNIDAEVDWSGVFIDDELNNIEKSMAIIQQFIEQEEK